MHPREIAVRCARREAERVELELQRGIWWVESFGATAFFWGVGFCCGYILRHAFGSVVGEKSAIVAAIFYGLGDAVAGLGLGLGIAIGLYWAGLYLRGRVAAMAGEMRVAILDMELSLWRIKGTAE